MFTFSFFKKTEKYYFLLINKVNSLKLIAKGCVIYKMESTSYLNELKSSVLKSKKRYNLELIEKAFNFANNAHKSQVRKTGEPYISHPVNVALILLELGMDTNSIVAGLLHDVVEDTSVSIDVLSNEFGATVARIVEGLTKFKTVIVHRKNRKDDLLGLHRDKIFTDSSSNDNFKIQQIENIQKILIAMSKDVRVIIIKLADRLHNLKTADGWPQTKRCQKALETIEIYAPLAQQLGITVIKEQLQDLALKILDPIAYDEISKMLKINKKKKNSNFNGKDYINYLEKKAFEKLKPLVDSFQISGRVKSHYAIYSKIYVDGKDWNEIFDIYAIRIVVNTVLECYGVLGAMHNLFKPLQNRFKDYIATPKANFYQSLHTTVMDDCGVPFEIQIRTKQMQYIAEYGVAAHWKYKQKIKIKSKLEEKLSWVRRIIELQRASDNVDDFFQMFKTDLDAEEIFVFTPKGEVKSLPAVSTVVDFAYLIGENLGNKMIGAKINGKSVPIDTKLESNQVIEIVTTKSKNYSPSRNWLTIAKTSEARNRIRAWFKKERRNENIKRGAAEIKKEFLRNSVKLRRIEQITFMEKVAELYGFKSVDDFYAAVGYGAINVSNTISKIKKLYLEFKKVCDNLKLNLKPVKFNNKPLKVNVDGLGICLVTLSKCCNPIPGCKVVGYITKNRGISIHCTKCSNIWRIKNKNSKTSRFVKVRFERNLRVAYKTNLKLIIKSETYEKNVLTAINLNMLNSKIKMHGLKVICLNNGAKQLKLTIKVICVSQLKTFVEVLQKINGVETINVSTKY